MKQRMAAVALFCLMLAVAVTAQAPPASDTFKTSAGDLTITFVGHGTLMFAFGGKIIHVDPFSGTGADYATLPKADVILYTHEHQDHLDQKALASVRKDGTEIVAPDVVAKQVPGAAVMNNGDVKTIGGVKIEAVPAYNIVHKRDNGQPYHAKGNGNGYVLTFGATRVYVAGDTEGVPEVAALKNIDVAFLPMNLPYTMTPEMVAEAAKAMAPKILYPYHTGNSDTAALVNLLKDTKGIEVRIRAMK